MADREVASHQIPHHPDGWPDARLSRRPGQAEGHLEVATLEAYLIPRRELPTKIICAWVRRAEGRGLRCVCGSRDRASDMLVVEKTLE